MSDNKFHENPSSRSRVFPCGRTDGQRTDMTKPPVVSRNFANAPKNESLNIRESKTFEQTSWNMHSVSRTVFIRSDFIYKRRKSNFYYLSRTEPNLGYMGRVKHSNLRYTNRKSYILKSTIKFSKRLL